MNDLSPSARWYLYGVWMTAGIAIAIALESAQQPLNLTALIAAVVCFTIADLFAVTIDVEDGGQIMMTVVDTLEIFLAAVMGVYGVIAVLFGSIASDLIARRPWYKGLFNGSQRSIVFLSILLAYTLIADPAATPFAGAQGLLAAIVMVALFFMLNPMFVAGIIALNSNQPLLRMYWRGLSQVHWIHFITLPLGAVLAALWSYNPWLLIPGVIPLIMAHRSFAAIASLQNESKRNKALALQAQATTAKLERLQDTTTAMLSSSEPQPLLELVSQRLAALLNAPAAWTILFDPPRLAATVGVAATFRWDADAYQAALQPDAVIQIDAARIKTLHPGESLPWQTVMLLPMATDHRLLGAFCFGLDAPLALKGDDQRVLLAFAAQAAMVVERTQLFEQLHSNQEELIRSSKLAALGTFAAGFAHEFNNLLAAVRGFAELGLTTDDVKEKDEALEVALRTCTRGQSITAGLLTFARRRESLQEPCNLQAIVEETLILIERELAKAGITIVRAYEPVPLVQCDQGQLAQVMMNLLTNARDAMADQHGGTITIGLRSEGANLALTVKDTGCGIPDHLRDQIFQPFMTTKGALGGSRTPGTGLGLAIIHGIITEHGGTIQVESAPGAGATFTIRLPINNNVAATPPPIADQADQYPVRILVIDDEPDVAESLRRLLVRRGFVVTAVSNGQAALNYYAQAQVDLVLSDIIMPEMDGPQLVRGLRALNPNVVVIGMTGHLQTPQTEQMHLLGARAILRKPFDLTELVRVIRACAPLPERQEQLGDTVSGGRSAAQTLPQRT